LIRHIHFETIKNRGQLNIPAGLNGVVAVAGGLVHSLALKGDGTVVAWGCSLGNVGQCTVPSDLSNGVAIAAGRLHSLALKGDGTVVAWG
jgi:alpha-tubulin suppressor-like RCC1 family protein